MSAYTEHLQYIKNTNGGATKMDYLDDFYPVGNIVWEEMTRIGTCMVEERGGHIFLTEYGREYLEG